LELNSHILIKEGGTSLIGRRNNIELLIKIKNMTTKIKKVIELIEKFVPKNFGIKEAYYKTEKNSVEFIFFINEKDASKLIGYLNSLSKIIEKEIKGVKIESRIYIKSSKKNVNELVEEKKLETINLRSLSYAI